MDLFLFYKIKPYLCIALEKRGGYQSGQMGQTVNLLAMPSVVRIHHHPLQKRGLQTICKPLFMNI